MKILVLAQNYPSDKSRYAMAYVHTRCLGYLKSGHDVVVLSFSAINSYEYEGVGVRPEEQINWEEYDVICSHAPNLKNHVRYLWKVNNKRVVFFFHGHEVLKRSDYPEPYSWNKKIWIKSVGVALYDFFKLRFLRKWLKKFSDKNNVGLVFVSHWMKEQFEKRLKLPVDDIFSYAIIPNAVHQSFLDNSYSLREPIFGDFITIRPFDESKYAIDLIVQFAKKNKDKVFHLYGNGRYFEFNETPENMILKGGFVSQKDIPALLDRYRCALMPTRYDAQGVMACEMATYGIPLITTDVDICREMLDGFENCMFLPLDKFSSFDFKFTPQNLVSKNDRFSEERLISKELDFIIGLTQNIITIK